MILTQEKPQSVVKKNARPAYVPLSTYRLQMNKEFPFSKAQAILGYLKNLGVSDCYLSPIFTARAGSSHGYDVVDPRHVNPELGGEPAFAEFAQAASALGIHTVLDIVPNHMCITDPKNPYWMDVLENGPASPYAKFFDINWSPSKKELQNKVLLPFLGDQYGKVLENGELRIDFQDQHFWMHYYETKLPISPGSWNEILQGVLARVATLFDAADPNRMELESILTAINYLPNETDTAFEKMEERGREKEVLRKRWSALVESNAFVADALTEELALINGQKGQPKSFDRLEALLERQVYRLCDWKVASDEINYRRFFDINELAALQVERDDVFDEIHKSVFEWIGEGRVHGLRVDHVDGLLDPERYLTLLQDRFRSARPDAKAPLYVAVEKILSDDESLQKKWPVSGATGYEFMHRINGLFVDAENAASLRQFYRKFSGQTADFSDVVASTKKLIMIFSMASELRMLSGFLDGISEQHRWSRDFTHESLRFALREVVAGFPVYRTYIHDETQAVTPADRQAITTAAADAKRRNPAMSESIFDFIESVLTLNHPDGLTDAQKHERFQFVLKLQQFTGPVMAKGTEDTAFYRYVPLISLNEVGGRPDQFGLPRREFHSWMKERQALWPNSLSASTTHDTKRSEDVRARVNVLSEIPALWGKSVRKWHKLNFPHKMSMSRQREFPDKNEEYLLYQTLVGSWPLSPGEQAGYVKRIQDFMIKAIREAKVNSSWIRPHKQYEEAATEFVRKALDPELGAPFLKEFEEFHRLIVGAGLNNGLAQALLKITAPGIPDFYQGSEIWDFRLVDPDNREPVDYEKRQTLLTWLQQAASQNSPEELAGELKSSVSDGRLKLLVVHQALELRARWPNLFSMGRYIPLRSEGVRRRNVVAFARQHDDEAVIVAVGRFFMDFPTELSDPTALWGDTHLELREFAQKGTWRDIYSQRRFENLSSLTAADLFAHYPFACLERVRE